MKGQIAFEGLLVVLIVFSMAIFVSGLYLQNHSSTVALSIAREEISSLANSNEELIIIKSLKLKGNEIIVKTDPSGITRADLGNASVREIEDLIESSSGIDASIIIN